MLFAGLGGILFLVGMVWLIIIAVQTGQTTGEKAIWGLVNFFCQPLGGIIFYFMKRQGLVPLILMIVGWAICAFGYYGMMGDMMRQMPR
jgi:hypothetical protein